MSFIIRQDLIHNKILKRAWSLFDNRNKACAFIQYRQIVAYINPFMVKIHATLLYEFVQNMPLI